MRRKGGSHADDCARRVCLEVLFASPLSRVNRP
jgi:hypothetical protein